MVTMDEVLSVRSLSTRDDRNNSIFQNNTSIVTFNEFKFFKALNMVNSNTFMGCTALREVSFPVGVENIGDSVLQKCSSLRKVMIPEGYRVIGRLFCEGCISMEIIDLPSTLESINVGLIWALNDQISVICRAVIPPAMSNLNARPLALYVPDESLSAYQVASGWSQYAKFMKPLSEYEG